MTPEAERTRSPSDGPSLAPGATMRPSAITLSGTLTAPRWASPWWLLLLGLAVAEVLALWVREQRVPPEQDWVAAAQLVRSQLESTDAITVAPGWADPLLRLYLGDRIPAKVAGRVDLASFERLWVLSIRGDRSPEAPPRAPDFREVLGRVTVERYDFGPTPVVLDLVDALPSASVEYVVRGQTMPCPWNERVESPARGGLGFGPVWPRQRFVCDPARPWLWVGTTMLEDLSLAPRRCIWQHPEGTKPVSVTYHDVHLGTRLVLYAGLDYHNERDEEGAPVTMRVLIDGQYVGELIHRDGEGMKRVEIDTSKRPAGAPARGELRFEVTTDQPFRRSFCWAGTIQDARRREAP